MMRSVQRQEGDITVVVTNSHQGAAMDSGWDIASINIAGIVRPSGKKGDYATEEEAIQAAIKPGDEFKKTFTER